MRIKSVLISLVFVGTLSAMENNRAIQDLQNVVRQLPDEWQKIMQKDVFDHWAVKRPRDFNRLVYDLPDITQEQAGVAIKNFDIERDQKYAYRLFARVRSDEVKLKLSLAFLKRYSERINAHIKPLQHGLEKKERGYCDKIRSASKLGSCSIVDSAVLLCLLVRHYNQELPNEPIHVSFVRSAGKSFFDKKISKVFIKVLPNGDDFLIQVYSEPLVADSCTII